MRSKAPGETARISTSLLDHGCGVRGSQYVGTEYREGQVHFTIRPPRTALRCPACGSREVRPHGTVERRFRAVPIGSQPVFIAVPIPRVRCQDRRVTRPVAVACADPRRSDTKAFERDALELSRYMTIRDVARPLGVSWDVIKDIQFRALRRRCARPKLGGLTRIAIDESAVGQGQHDLTVVLDRETGAVVFVGDGRGGDARKPLWTRPRRAKAGVEAVAMDISPAYQQAVSADLGGRSSGSTTSP